MHEFWRQIFDPNAFIPHIHRYLWHPGLVWLHVATDLAIGFSYLAISVSLAVFLRPARKEVPFTWIFVAFGVFILACGATHFMEVWTLWTPIYCISGIVKVVTAVASVATAVMLPFLVPKALTLIQVSKVAAQRKADELYQSDGRPGVRCVVTWQGSLNDRAVRDPANEVRSVTPFVTARHLKKKQDPAEFYEAEIRRECRNQNYPEPLEVDRIDDKLGLFVAVEYRRNRPDDPARPGLAFRLKFAEPIITPFSLGYGSHFGLGQFVPIPDAQKNSSFASIKPIT